MRALVLCIEQTEAQTEPQRRLLSLLLYIRIDKPHKAAYETRESHKGQGYVITHRERQQIRETA